MSGFCASIENELADGRHVRAAHEGLALSVAAGHWMSTGAIPVVYLQNSGIGNLINPLVSLFQRDVFPIPILLIVGWRGAPGFQDEPQHRMQGEITRNLFQLLEVPTFEINANTNLGITLDKVFQCMKTEMRPHALLIKPKSIMTQSLDAPFSRTTTLTRHRAIEVILANLRSTDRVIGTTGKIAREVHAVASDKCMNMPYLMVVGGMGHASSIALGLSLGNPASMTVCLDGDGAALMHLGALAMIGNHNQIQILHVILDNGVHESVGGQNTANTEVPYDRIASELGYSATTRVDTESALKNAIETSRSIGGMHMIHVLVSSDGQLGVGRPNTTPTEQLSNFVARVRGGDRL